MDIEFSLEENNAELVKKASDEAIQKALEVIGSKIADYATMACPADTGLLRNSITYALWGQPPDKTEYEATYPDKSGEKRTGVYEGTAPDELNTVFVGSNVEYAAYVEAGTSKRAATPYLEPAFVDHKQEYQDITMEYLQKD